MHLEVFTGPHLSCSDYQLHWNQRHSLKPVTQNRFHAGFGGWASGQVGDELTKSV